VVATYSLGLYVCKIEREIPASFKALWSPDEEGMGKTSTASSLIENNQTSVPSWSGRICFLHIPPPSPLSSWTQAHYSKLNITTSVHMKVHLR
jgi:hypothetical protein